MEVVVAEEEEEVVVLLLAEVTMALLAAAVTLQGFLFLSQPFTLPTLTKSRVPSA
jgi:hypothetical protein